MSPLEWFEFVYTAGRGLGLPTLEGIGACVALAIIFAGVAFVLSLIDPDDTNNPFN